MTHCNECGDLIPIRCYCHTCYVQLEAENARLREFAEDVLNWSKAYPVEVFPEPTPEQVDEVCKILNFRIDRISAMVLRAFTKTWGDKARAALGKE
jgi:hypothetical protein